MGLPKIFIPPVDYRAGASPEQIAIAVRRATAAGLDGFFAGDHVTFHGGAGNDALMQLASLAPMTGNAQLMTSIYLLALRHPVPVARQCIQLDRLSGGRLILGVGLGGESPQEYQACGVDPSTRARRTDEALQILLSLWTQEETTFEGKYFQLRDVQMQPKPLREGGIPVWVGGRSDKALQRVARFGDGWISIWGSARRMAEAREKIDEWAAAEGRDPSQINLGLQVWCSVDANPEMARWRLSERMLGFYQIPFEEFQRYSPFGLPEDIAEFLAPYVEAGCNQFNLLLVQESPEDTVEAAVAVKEALAKIVGG